jgi:hypothetical protein
LIIYVYIQVAFFNEALKGKMKLLLDGSLEQHEASERKGTEREEVGALLGRQRGGGGARIFRGGGGVDRRSSYVEDPAWFFKVFLSLTHTICM